MFLPLEKLATEDLECRTYLANYLQRAIRQPVHSKNGVDNITRAIICNSTKKSLWICTISSNKAAALVKSNSETQPLP